MAGSLLSVVLTLFMPDHVKESTTESAASKDEDSPKGKDTLIIPSVAAVVSIVWLFLSTKIITSVANAMGAAAFPLILKDFYHLNEASLGVTMSVMSACNALVNGFLLGPILAMAGGSTQALIGYCVLLMCVLSSVQSLVGMPAVATLSLGGGMYEYIGLSFLLSMLQYVLSTTITSESTTRVGHNAKGTLLGLEHSLFAAARVFAPQAGVYLLQEGGVTAVSGACAGVFLLVYVAWQSLHDEKTVMPTVSGGEGERKEK